MTSDPIADWKRAADRLDGYRKRGEQSPKEVRDEHGRAPAALSSSFDAPTLPPGITASFLRRVADGLDPPPDRSR